MRSARRRTRRHGEAGGHEAAGMGRWLLTYSDMITLLLALFIILFSISVVNGKKFLAFKLGLVQSFSNSVVQRSFSDSLLEKQKSALALPHSSTSTTQQTQAHSTLRKLAARLTRALTRAGLSQETNITLARQGVVVKMFADKAYFQTDSADLQPIGDAVIDTIAGVLRGVPNHVEVQGYTDNVPITGGPYISNWELSAARAAAAVVRFVTHDKLTGNRMSAVGFGSTHPLATNATAAGRAQNRRVDIVVLTTKIPAPGDTSTPSPATASSPAAVSSPTSASSPAAVSSPASASSPTSASSPASASSTGTPSR